MTILIVLIGAGLVFVALRDIFQQLFRPHGQGSLSRLLMRSIWRLFSRFAARRPALLGLAGPSVLLAIIATWVVLLVIGSALIFWPYLPEGFLLATGLHPQAQDSLIDALYLSLVTLTTLGYGDITPTSGLLRILAPLEALVGFGLLTAAISWVLSIYPALSRRRSLAQRITLIRNAESQTGIGVTQMGAEAAERMLDSLTSQLVTVRGDLLQFPVTYYFYSTDERSSLPACMPALIRFVEKSDSAGCSPAVRLRAAALRDAIEVFSGTVASRFLGLASASTDDALTAYARDHLQTPLSEDADRESPSEQEAEERTARSVGSRSLLRYLDLDGDEALAEVEIPCEWVGRSLSELQLAHECGLTVLLLKRKGGYRTVPDEGTTLREGDVVVTWSSKEDLGKFNIFGAR